MRIKLTRLNILILCWFHVRQSNKAPKPGLESLDGNAAGSYHGIVHIPPRAGSLYKGLDIQSVIGKTNVYRPQRSMIPVYTTHTMSH